MTDAELEARYPMIQWREPSLVTMAGYGAGLACRLCIARFGLRAGDTSRLFTADEFEAHMIEIHGGDRAG